MPIPPAAARAGPVQRAQCYHPAANFEGSGKL